MDDIVASYRIQLRKEFTFYDLMAIIPYLAGLGISHVYLSPICESVPGSNHGYDVIDFDKVSTEKGGEAGLMALDDALVRHGMGMVLDIVPNHMAANVLNPYWYDVLKNGPDSAYWRYFDMRVPLNGKIRIPVLTHTLSYEIEAGNIAVDEATRRIRCFNDYYPLKDDNTAYIEDVLSRQHYEFVDWRDSYRQISYRRFFEVTGLIGIRVEDDAVFEATHKKLFELRNNLKSLTGVRIDHIDGLADPTLYLKKLRHYFDRIWVEKILGPNERLPSDWPVLGTTGYEFINQVNRLMVNPFGYKVIRDFWGQETHSRWDNFSACVRESKEYVLKHLFSAELNRLSDPDIWSERIIDLPVYRTYDGASEWQQLSGPVMAKGLEDTAHYRYTPLMAFNEVGCAPDLPFLAPHEFCELRNDYMKSYPAQLNASSTHDTKRSGDVRARLYALSHMPQEWISLVCKLYDLAGRKIDWRIAYIFYQHVVGSWPDDFKIDDHYKERLQNYMLKAAREMKLQTSWLEPDSDFESNMRHFVESSLQSPEFLQYIGAFWESLAPRAAVMSLTAQSLQILTGGVPDVYQGTEVWRYLLVDPDNRQLVDFQSLQKMFQQMKEDEDHDRQMFLRNLCRNWRNGMIKMYLISRLLSLRAELGLSFRMEAIPVAGPCSDRVMALSIRGEDCLWLAILPINPGPVSNTLSYPEEYGADTYIILPRACRLESLISNVDYGWQEKIGVSRVLREFPLEFLRMSQSAGDQAASA